MLARSRDGLKGESGGCLGERGEDSAGVKPAHPEGAEDMIPIEVAGFELAGGGVAAVGIAQGAPDAEPAFGEIKAVANGPADAVVLAPFDEVGRDAALHNEVLDQVADFVVDEGGRNGGF